MDIIFLKEECLHSYKMAMLLEIDVHFTTFFVQAQLYTVLELCRSFDRIFKEHLDGS
jgi:hypothetical protein